MWLPPLKQVSDIWFLMKSLRELLKDSLNPPEGAMGKARHRRKEKRRIDQQIANLYRLRLCLHVRFSFHRH